MTTLRTSLRTAAVAGLVAGAALVLPGPGGAIPVHAQDDVVALGLRHGTRPPPEYFELRAANPDAFTFDRAWMRRNPSLEVIETPAGPRVEFRGDTRFDAAGAGVAGAPPSGPAMAGAVAARANAVTGTIAVPLLLGVYADSPNPVFTRAEVQDRFFDGPNPTGTVPDYYAEISGGRLTMVGETFDWRRTSLSRAQVTGGSSGLGGSSRVGEFILQLLRQADDAGTDWGRYDNDGPDGIPNSGDDDGYVDVLGVMHGDFGGECGGDGQDDRVWSHRWSLRSAVGQVFTTSTPSANGGLIRVSDYTIQPVQGCGGGSINDIGVVAHELGHGLGLPDLYAVNDGSSPPHQGIGNWGLMATGSYGCTNGNSARPCWMAAWSRVMLGWADVVDVPAGTPPALVTLPAVETTGRVLRIPIPGTAQYYLLENRQPLGFDSGLLSPGLLVFHIDDDVIASKWPSNRINSDPARMGVRLVEADGRDDLRRRGGNRGDDSDPFPGTAGRTEFHAGSTPAARTRTGAATGLTVRGVRIVGTDVEMTLGTDRRTLTLVADGAPAGTSLFTVAGASVPSGASVEVIPFDVVTVEAASGAPVSDGVRRAFDGWTDGVAGATRSVTVGDDDLELVARFDREQVRVATAFTGERFGVSPGRLVATPSSPDLWFDRGTGVELDVEATPGFAFLGFTGAFEGAARPLALTLDEPVTVAGDFAYVYGIDTETSVELAGGDEVTIELTTTSGTGPITWRMQGGVLPPGLSLDGTGRVTGIARQVGSWAVTVGAEDALGLQAAAQLRFTVARPAFPDRTLAAPFLGIEGLTDGQRIWLDLTGNGNGVYDLDDLRTYVIQSATAPTAAVPTTGELRMTLPMHFVDPRGPVRGGGR